MSSSERHSKQVSFEALDFETEADLTAADFEAETQTDDFDDDIAEDRGLVPAGGWDNAPDIEEAKGYLSEIVLDNSDAGIERCRMTAVRLRDFGISENLAADLILQYVQPTLKEKYIRGTLRKYYRTATSLPGQLSKATPPTPRFTPTPPQLAGNAPQWPKQLLYEKDQNDAKMSEVFLAARPFDLIVSAKEIYTLDDKKLWRKIDEDELTHEVRLTDAKNRLNTDRIRKIVDAIKVARFTKARPFEWINPPNDAPDPRDLILFDNGILDFNTGKLLDHDGAFFTTGLPGYDYDAKAKCPLFDRCVGQWLHPSFHATLFEFMGYALVPDTTLHKILVLIGVTRGGKSTLIRLVSQLIGAAHVVSTTLSDLGGEFGLQPCLDKRLLIVPDAHDTPRNKRTATLDRLKTISGGDTISVNRKNIGQLSVTLPTRIMLAANKHPKWLDESGALATREIVLLFERSFIGKEDAELGDKLARELPGIANRALAGLERLRYNGGRFTIGERGKEAAADVRDSQSPAYRFAKACLILDAGHSADPDKVHEVYRMWCEQEHLAPSERRDRDELKNDLVAALTIRGVRYRRVRVRSKNQAHGPTIRKRRFIGMSIRSDWLRAGGTGMAQASD